MTISPIVGISALAGKPDLSDFGARLDEALAFGVGAIELPLYDLDVIVGGQVRCDQLARLKTYCAGRDVAYTVHGPLAINFFDEPWRLHRHFEVLKASVEIAAELGAVHYVLHSGITRRVPYDGLEDCYLRQREWLARAGDLGQDFGVVICVENLFGDYDGNTLTAGPSRLAHELAAINHEFVQATLDFSHGHLNLGYIGGDLVKECAELAPRAQHLHIHDSFGRQDDIWMFTDGERLAYGHGDLHLPIGWGNIPWADLMEACTFPEGVIFNIELDSRYWHEGLACVDATKALAFAARLMSKESHEIEAPPPSPKGN